MTDKQFMMLLSEIDPEQVLSSAPLKTHARRTPGFLRRFAAAAAAVLLVMLVPFSTAGASGVSVIKPFVAWAEGGLRLDYSAGPVMNDGLPESTVDPAEAQVVTHEPGTHYTFDSIDALKKQFCKYIRIPDEGNGLVFVSANVSDTGDEVSSMMDYTFEGKAVNVDCTYQTEPFGTEYSAQTLIINGAFRSEYGKIGEIDCTRIYGSQWNYISFVIDNESYLISGEVEMTVLEEIAESMFINAY